MSEGRRALEVADSESRLPGFLRRPFLRTVGLGAFVALACEVLLLPRLVGLDATLWRAILYARSCATDRAVDHIVEVTTALAIVLLVVAALLRARIDGLRAAWPPLAVCLLGLQVGKLLKNVFARERPSMLSGAIVGHSFPSGHVMNTTLAAIAIVVLAAAFRHPRRWSTATLALLTIIFLGRLLLAHHWLLDALGAVFAAVALNGLALPIVRRRPLLAPALLALATTAVLTIVTHHRELAVRLPSPLTAPNDGIEVHVADALGTEALAGAWEGSSDRFRRGTFLWFDGPVTVTLDVPVLHPRGELSDPLRSPAKPTEAQAVPSGWQASLAFAGRPDLRERRCLSMRVSVNGWNLPAYVPFVGWREYRLLLPPETLRPGRNEVRFEVSDASGASWRFALVYVRLDLD